MIYYTRSKEEGGKETPMTCKEFTKLSPAEKRVYWEAHKKAAKRPNA